MWPPSVAGPQEDCRGLIALKEQTKLASSVLGITLKLRHAGGPKGGGGGGGGHERPRLIPVIWGHFLPFVVGRRSRLQGGQGQRRQAISYHRALPPRQPSHLLYLLRSHPQAPRRVSAYPQQRWSRGSARVLLDLPLLHCGSLRRAARRPAPGSPSACGRPRTPRVLRARSPG